MDNQDYYSIDAILADNQVRLRTQAARSPPAPLELSAAADLDDCCIWCCPALQKLPCTFLLDVEGLGYLDGGSGNDVSLVFV